MPEEFLDSSDIVAVFKQTGGKRMPEGVTTSPFGVPGFPDDFFDRTLQDGFVKMMPFQFTGLPILITL